MLNKFNASRKKRGISSDLKQIVAFDVTEYGTQSKKELNQSQNISSISSTNVEIDQKKFNDEFIVVSKKDNVKNIHNKIHSVSNFKGKYQKIFF